MKINLSADKEDKDEFPSGVRSGRLRRFNFQYLMEHCLQMGQEVGSSYTNITQTPHQDNTIIQYTIHTIHICILAKMPDTTYILA